MPTSIRAGDALVLVLATSATSPADPSGPGWSLVKTMSVASLTSKVWSKVATASDAGTTVTVSSPLTAKSAVDLLAYRGTAATPLRAAAAAAETTSRVTHTTPTVIASGGDRVLSVTANLIE